MGEAALIAGGEMAGSVGGSAVGRDHSHEKIEDLQNLFSEVPIIGILMYYSVFILNI